MSRMHLSDFRIFYKAPTRRTVHSHSKWIEYTQFIEPLLKTKKKLVCSVATTNSNIGIYWTMMSSTASIFNSIEKSKHFIVLCLKWKRPLLNVNEWMNEWNTEWLTVTGDGDLNSLVWIADCEFAKFHRMKCNSKARMSWMQIVHYKIKTQKEQ